MVASSSSSSSSSTLVVSSLFILRREESSPSEDVLVCERISDSRSSFSCWTRRFSSSSSLGEKEREELDEEAEIVLLQS